MSTEHMPNPITNPTVQATDAAVKAASAPAEAADESVQGGEGKPLSLREDMARIIREQLDIIAQRQIYHSQMLLGVSAMGTDPVSARTAALMVANGLDSGDRWGLEHALINLGNAQIAQVNDRTTPYKFNAQIAGLLEGILIDVVTSEYRDDPTNQQQARLILNALFEPANERMQLQPKSMLAFSAPAFGADRKQLSPPEETRPGG